MSSAEIFTQHGKRYGIRALMLNTDNIADSLIFNTLHESRILHVMKTSS